MVKGVIVDFDGVNRKVLPIGFKVYFRGMLRLGFWRSVEIFGFVLHLFWQEVIAYCGSLLQIKPWSHALLQRDIIPGSIEIVQKLKQQGFLLGMVTNRKRKILEWHAARVGLDLDLFDLIVCRDGILKKPNPAVFNIFRQEWKVDFADLTYIGDRYELDYLAAVGADIGQIYMVCSGYTTREDFLRLGVPESQILDSLAELPIHR